MLFPIPENGDVVLVYRKDEGTILARWLKAPSGTWLLKDNTATDEHGDPLYPSMPFTAGDRVSGIVAFVAWQPVRKPSVAALTVRLPRSKRPKENLK